MSSSFVDLVDILWLVFSPFLQILNVSLSFLLYRCSFFRSPRLNSFTFPVTSCGNKCGHACCCIHTLGFLFTKLPFSSIHFSARATAAKNIYIHACMSRLPSSTRAQVYDYVCFISLTLIVRHVIVLCNLWELYIFTMYTNIRISVAKLCTCRVSTEL